MPNLILLHGALGHSDIFKPYLNVLSSYFTVHTPLFSGHGDQELPEGSLTIKKYVQELSEYCKVNNLTDVSIFGHSMGGYVALCYAMENPDNVNSVITLGTKFDWTEEEAIKESKMLNPDVILEKIPQYAQLLESQHGTKWKQLLPAIADLMIDLGKNPPLENNFATITTPVQIMVGDKDNMVTLEESARVYRSLPNAKLAVLPDTKHPMDKVRPNLLLNLIKDFWNLS
ncbi:pimeloyl-ACP methyl ester carboxylesterase [Chryseobacterium bernardetii]|uniref:Pimeloyl-ACP methyl ester carboxylesterase n=2 Tax=Chryseobacterium TaxID=59732 RepID=A0A543EN32_9FLAO|nr:MULTISPECIES: alpha/beta hydrolase [Chryseobacterium]MDR6369387.1 pimeloyl-ACP methyl ester carboxylesterase [Chryseobacterium vietnamense]MDR6439691.1 pimeloyl-ACP methyl ester carboxylesterase [Chryseobacterium bernardetii]TQM22986.1 pimeloyl-ACP methyl ester carboxylesterase [Chryseobacterium aquifrigidense]